MTISWSTSELEEIKKQKMGDLRPSYYSTTNKNFIQISEDFEGYLILQNSSDKQKILTWISDVEKIDNNTKDQNTILDKYMTIRSDDADARITELDAKLNNYDDMQTSLITDGTDPARYGTIVELSQMITSISKPLENISIQRDQAFHEKNIILAVTNKIKSEQISDESSKELDSWKSIMSSYRGQSSKSGNSVGKNPIGGGGLF